MRDSVLGLDLGPNSIGWALLDARFFQQGEHETYEVTGFADTARAGHPPAGVRVFEAGLHNFGRPKEKSLCQDRRVARSMRRNHQRRAARRKALRKALVRAGLLPGDPAEQERLAGLDPYELRARALDQALTPQELGRALFHLGQRRGFQSNRKSGKAKEDQGMLKEIGDLAREIDEEGSRTLGEHLFRLSRDSNGTRRPLERGEMRLRKRHTRRDMYREEFEAIIAAQQPFHPDALTEEAVDAFRQAIFFQHPFELTEERRRRAPSRANLHRAPSVRPCLLEPGEKCCARGLWIAQQFRILKEVNNLRLTEHSAAASRPLTSEERSRILARLASNEKATFDQLRKEIEELLADPYAVFNLEAGERGYLHGNSVEDKLAKAFGRKAWGALDDAVRARLRLELLETERTEHLVASLVEAGCDPQKAEKLAGWAPADGYLAYSEKAVRRLLPHLEEGKNEFEAIQLAYPERAEADRFDRLPALNDKRLPHELRDITNPVVRRALVEVRKVVNALIREQGLPRRIVIEMGREMKGGPEERKRASKQNAQRRREREDAALKVMELGGNPRSRSDVNRYLLWKEQGGTCLYTGRPIPQNEIVTGGEWEVDHILPRWQSLDDSLANKVLVHRSANQEKGDRTPAQWLGFDSQEHRQLLQRAEDAFRGNPGLRGKLGRLRQPEVEADGFARRQLNDTRYITKLVSRYLSLLYPAELRQGEKAIQTCRGSLTAELRRQWSLNDVLDPLTHLDGSVVMDAEPGDDGQPRKSRADHRHHAVDAVVVALSSRSALKRYQDHWRAMAHLSPAEAERRHLEGGAFPPPWEGFRDTVAGVMREILPSHRAMRRVRGGFHEETFYGPAKDRRGNPKPGRFVTRKALDQLSPKMVGQIRDGRIRTLVEERLNERGWTAGKALPEDWHLPELRMPSGVPVRKVRIEVTMNDPVALNGDTRFAVVGNNHHMALLRNPETDELLVEVVSRMEAAQRLKRGAKSAIPRQREDGLELVFSLSRKESVLLTSPDTGETRFAVLQTLAGDSQPGTRLDVVLRDLRDSRPASQGNKAPLDRVRSIKRLAALCARKVSVDSLGRLQLAFD